MQTTFTPENFQKAFKPYRIKFAIAYLIVMCPILILCLCIGIPNWQFSQWLVSVFMDMGAMFDGKAIKHGVLTISAHTAAIIAIGINAFGAFAVGVNAVGVIVIGTNALGVIAIGANACGIVAIGTNAIGVIVIVFGELVLRSLYTLQYTKRKG